MCIRKYTHTKFYHERVAFLAREISQDEVNCAGLCISWRISE